MTDDEIISQFLGGAQGMMGNFPSDAQAQAMCRQNASQVSGGLDRMKLEAAKCQAEAAVSCEAKKEAAKQCNSIDNDPSQTARLVVDNMCRKFGVSTGNGSQSQQDLYKAAANIANADPAAANQLGDTADKTVQDKAKLGLFDKLVGNGDYAQKIKDRADKLKEIRQKLESAGNVDKETLALLDEQIKSLEEESGNFSNLLGIFGRLAS